jgi:hypothetical protein
MPCDEACFSLTLVFASIAASLLVMRFVCCVDSHDDLHVFRPNIVGCFGGAVKDDHEEHDSPCSALIFSLFSRRVDALTDLTSPRQNFESFRDFEGQNQGNPGGGSTSRCGSVVINTQSYLLTR